MSEDAESLVNKAAVERLVKGSGEASDELVAALAECADALVRDIVKR